MAERGPFDPPETASAGELRARLRALETLIASAPIPIAIAHDPGCRVITANAALASLLHTPVDSNISLTPPDQKRPYRIQRNGQDIPDDELPMQFAIAQRTRVSNEIDIVRADGSVLHVQNDVEPLFDTQGRIYGCVSVVVDLTHRTLAEQALREADRRKDEFLATLSHELRNPLAPIRNALEVMRLAHDNPEVVAQARAIMERQLQHLVRITDDLLDVSRIAQNKVLLHRDRIDLRAVVHSAVEVTRSLVDEEGHALTLDLPSGAVWVDGDFTRMAQTFANLLNNAAKYTERGGRIRISVTTEEGIATVTVADTGVGIPPAMLPRIFDMFTQLEPFRDRTHGGLGIGLTLVKRLVELHGGSVEARSEGRGRGSSFVVRLPVAVGPPRPAPRGDAALTARRGCRILVAEDDADAAEMLRVMLTFMGQEVRVAADGAEAIAVALEFKPQIALLDIGMPRVDGFEAARRIRELLGDRVVIVAVTGWGQDEDKRLAREAGFDYHLTKPADPGMLERLISECGTPGQP